MSNENTKVDLNKSSDEELDKALEQTQNIKEGDAEVEIAEPVINTEADKPEPYLVEFEYPEKEGEKKPQEQPAQQPAKVEKPTAEEEAFKTLKATVPSMAKFNSLEEYKASLEKPAEQQQQPEQKKPEETAENIQLDEKDMAVITAKTFEFAGQDADIMALVASAGRKSTKLAEDDNTIKPITRLPQTKAEWDNLLDVSPELYNQIVTRINTLKGELTQTALDYKKQVVTAPETNKEVALNFSKRVEGYVAKLHKNYKPDDVKDLITNMEKFFEKAEKDPKYYVKNKGVSVLNENLLFADFLAEQQDIIAKITALGIRVNGNGEDVKKNLKQKSDGVSQKTLVNQGLSSMGKNVKNIRDDKVIATLSDAELDAVEEQTRKEIITNKEF